MSESKKETILENAEGIRIPEADNGDASPALESFLSREQEPKKPAKNAKGRKPLVIIITAVVVIAGLVLALILLRNHHYTESDDLAEPAELHLDVDKDGVHEASVSVDDSGSILQNGTGSLLSYVPADIKEIKVENQDGSFTVTSHTPEGEATVYTIVGFEDYELQDGIADEIASHSSALDFQKIIAANGNLADFGLDDPKATVNISFNDDTSAIIRVGNDAAGESTGTYLAFGNSNAVYLVSTDDVSPFLYSVNSLISLNITDPMEDSDNSDFTSATIWGTHFPEPITIEPNTDEAVEATYIVTAPRRMYANATEAYDIAGNIRGLYGEEVICANPSDSQLSSYGLSEPYAGITAHYPDTDITLHASAPGDDGLVYIYNPDKNVVYTIQLAAVCWAKTNLDLLTPENPLTVKKEAVSSIRFTAGGTDFTLDLSTTTDSYTDDSGNEQTTVTTTASYSGKELDEQNFSIFFQNLNAIKNRGAADGSGKSPVMSVTYTYSTGRESDTLTVTDTDSARYILALNGDTIGTASKAYIDSLIEGASALINGENVTSL